MGFRPNSFATVWSVEPGKGKFTKVRISVSKKNAQTGEFEQDFSGFCMFVGNAHAKAAKLKEKDRIRLGDIDVTSTYDRQGKKEYINFKVFSFDFADEVSGSGGRKPSSITRASEPDPEEGDVSDNRLPF